MPTSSWKTGEFRIDGFVNPHSCLLLFYFLLVLFFPLVSSPTLVHTLHYFSHPPLSPFREISLQNADEDERGKAASARGKKRKVPEAEEEEAGNSTEHWVLKRQKLKAQKEEEAIKNKRTVFVGNLPPSCTKKVRS